MRPIMASLTTTTTLALIAFIASVNAFSSITPSKKVEVFTGPVLYDPLGLYPKNAPERFLGRLQPLEDGADTTGPAGVVKDPLQIYTDASQVDQTTEMSASLPFAVRPAMLATVPGDRGFDPFNFAADENALQWYRVAEVKHARIAMLAAAGWPLSELFDKKLAYLLGAKPLLVFQDRVPSVLNGGLSRTPAAFWAATLGVAFAIETLSLMRSSSAEKAGGDYVPGDLAFDPLGLSGKTVEEKHYKLEAELFNGRLAMLAITGFAVQEWWTVNSVINQTPIFFKPMHMALEQLADAAGGVM